MTSAVGDFFTPFIHQQAGQKQDSLVVHLSELEYDSAFVSVDMLWILFQNKCAIK